MRKVFNIYCSHTRIIYLLSIKGIAEGLKHAFQHFRASSHLENSSLHRNALGYTYAAIHFRMILSDREREKI